MRRLRCTHTHCDRTLQLLLKTFFDLLLLRPGPERVPRSSFLLVLAAATSVVLSVATTRLIFPELPLQFLTTIVLVTVTVAYYYAVLMFAGHTERFAPTMTAIFGADVLLTLIYTAVYFLIAVVADRNSALILILLISYWSIPVQGLIISRSIAQHWAVGFGIALLCHLILVQTYRTLATNT